MFFLLNLCIWILFLSSAWKSQLLYTNYSSTCWRSKREGCNKTSSTKNRNEILWSPNWTSSGPGGAEVQGQPCLSSTCNGNRSDEPSSRSNPGRTRKPFVGSSILLEHLPQYPQSNSTALVSPLNSTGRVPLPLLMCQMVCHNFF